MCLIRLMCPEHSAGWTIEHVYPERGGRMVLVDIATLCALLACWIEHNTERANGFHLWAMRALEMGWGEGARQLEEATSYLTACNQALNAALRSLESPTISPSAGLGSTKGARGR